MTEDWNRANSFLLERYQFLANELKASGWFDLPYCQTQDSHMMNGFGFGKRPGSRVPLIDVKAGFAAYEVVLLSRVRGIKIQRFEFASEAVAAANEMRAALVPDEAQWLLNPPT